ncbi:MAG: hypothetical protein AB7T31_19000 [Gemmatimonadales bacterium]
MRIQVTGELGEGKTVMLRIIEKALLAAGYTVQANHDEHALNVGRTGTFDQQPRYLVDEGDLLKIRDCIRAAEEFHELRDRMNAQGHLAAQTRYSPLTSTLSATHDRLSAIIEGATL